MTVEYNISKRTGFVKKTAICFKKVDFFENV